jgi:hypothetical protein
MTITRTFAIVDLSPDELAAVFAGWGAGKQAAFFDSVGRIAETWPGAGMCMQALHIAAGLTPTGRYVIERIADHADLIPQVHS